MNSLLDILHPAFTCKPGQRQDWGNLQGSSLSLLISRIANEQPLIIITPDTFSAQRLLDETRFYNSLDLPTLYFPDWETLPYDLFSPHQDIISERLMTLYQLPHMAKGMIVLPITTLMQVLPPKDYVVTNSLILETGQQLDVNQLREQLHNSSYRNVTLVQEHGEFALRGNLIDLFPMGSHSPYRIDLFDDEIETIRYFDPETQRSLGTETSVKLLPAREFPLTDKGVEGFRQQWRQQFSGDPTKHSVYQDISQKITSPGIEYYLPLFFEKTGHLFDFLPQHSVIVTLEDAYPKAEQFWQDTLHRYEQLRHDIIHPILPPTRLFLQPNQVFAEIKHYAHLHLQQAPTTKGSDFATQTPPNLPVESRKEQPLAHLKTFIENFQGRILITAETTGRRENVLNLLQRQSIQPVLVDNWLDFLDSDDGLCLTVAPLEHGLLLENYHIALITEQQLFGERVAQRRLRKKQFQRDADAVVRDLTELAIGAPVVHEEHGVGRYQGLVTLELGGNPAEFLHLEYDRQDKLYVPVSALHLISRYTGVDPEHAPLHRLGSAQWEKAKKKAVKKITDVAAELLDIHAKRATRKGTAFKPFAEEYQAFAQTFPFEETPDQQDAIDAVLTDLQATQPMDRLVCGDVGFGKTEVALRAAFLAIQNNYQVALLVPTTLLAQQHYQNFQDRFAEWAIRVEQLSRFKTKKQQDTTLQAIAEGKVDIVIGTHKLLQNNIQFAKLGLVIIDEEHRFGVKQKERFKLLRAEVDILTLTATPIPRSLNMALATLRDLSVITTPPAKRLAIKTFVQEWHEPTLTEAIQRELKRGGQVYFVHNEVDTIASMASRIEDLVPEANVQFAHGQMRERELEKVMQNFYHRHFNVLVCTTIIENGIDIPSANTIIIHRADKFGLAQLHQLRGRVGRSHHRAYAYLIVPPKKLMTKDAVKRIAALTDLEELGVGFKLAMHDLEIRGAGELLGSEQSGHMQEIGFNLYTDLLERAVKALKSGQQPDLEKPALQGTDIDLHVPMLLPEDYMPDVHMRLIIYKRIANAPNEQALGELQVELIDRFGLLPLHAKNLLKMTELKLKTTPLGIQKIDLGKTGGYITFDVQAKIDPMKLVQWVQSNPTEYAFDGQKLRISEELPDMDAREKLLNDFLKVLG